MRVIGIDPGLNITGYGILDCDAGRIALVEGGFCSTRQSDDIALRIRSLHEDLLAVLREFKPQAAAIEQLYSHYAHPRTSILMGHARGVIMLAAALCDIPVVSYSATMIKRSLTGNGHAQKSQVQRMIAMTLGLSRPPEPPDVADALAAALCHLNSTMRTQPAELSRNAI